MVKRGEGCRGYSGLNAANAHMHATRGNGMKAGGIAGGCAGGMGQAAKLQNENEILIKF